MIKNLAKECLLLIYEVSEDFEASTDAIIALIKHKNIKVSYKFSKILISFSKSTDSYVRNPRFGILDGKL